MFYFILFLTFYFGCIIGSFLNVVILRLPKNLSLNGRSYCFFCKHELEPEDLVPLFSFLALFGKCRYCKKQISKRYFFIETLTGILFAFAYWFLKPMDVWGFVTLGTYFAAISAFICVFVIDFEHFLILDTVLLFGSVLFLIFLLLGYALAPQALFWHKLIFENILGLLFVPLPFFIIWFYSKGEWMGFGDVKFCLFLGLVLGLKIAFLSLFLAFILGGYI
jgi:leader peptidase (prepilin peptidase)/N-methyltransferase